MVVQMKEELEKIKRASAEYLIMEQGKAIIVSAPSGAGKTTIVHHLLDVFDDLSFSVSACSRQKRPGEEDGKDYYFLGVQGFRQKITEDAFVEWEEVYEDHYYGTLKSEVHRIWDSGRHVIFDVDVVGGKNLKKTFAHKALSIFVQPPSFEVLEERLRARQSESESMIQKRLRKAKEELEQAQFFDVIIVNDHLKSALNEADELVKNFLG